MGIRVLMAIQVGVPAVEQKAGGHSRWLGAIQKSRRKLEMARKENGNKAVSETREN